MQNTTVHLPDAENFEESDMFPAWLYGQQQQQQQQPQNPSEPLKILHMNVTVLRECPKYPHLDMDESCKLHLQKAIALFPCSLSLLRPHTKTFLTKIELFEVLDCSRIGCHFRTNLVWRTTDKAPSVPFSLFFTLDST